MQLFTLRARRQAAAEPHRAPAVLSNFARENRVTRRLVDYYAERAAGGAAMLVTEGLAIHAFSVPQPNVATVFDAANFEGFERLAAAVERHDCRLLGQLWHVGRQQLWSPVDAPVGVSACRTPTAGRCRT